ncbi:hypothetical protein Tco_0784421 [Tanacetum coccineum]
MYDDEPIPGVCTNVVDDIDDNFLLPVSKSSNDDLLAGSSILDVPFSFLSSDQLKIAPDYEASRAHGFVLRSLELQSLA